MIKRYWKSIAICICLFLVIVLGIKGIKIQTPEEVASNKAEVVVDDENSNKDGENVDSESQNEVVNNESGNDKEEAQKSESNEAAKALTPASEGKSSSSSNTGSVASEENKPSDQGDNNTGTNQTVQQTKSYVNFSIDAKTVLNNMGSLNPEKKNYIGNNGDIFSGKVEINDGESVLEVLRSTRIPLALKGSYIMGINNLLEQDCGSKSGWMYIVTKGNSTEIPGKSASDYIVHNGDTIAFRYTCDFGNDLR
jgi:hypothetical protein